MKSYRAIADYYDAENAHYPMLHQDVPFFLGHLGRKPRSVLELAVGTARAAIPIAQAGHRVVGIDYAPDMIKLAIQKRDSVGITARQLDLREENLLKFDLGKKFDWVCLFFNTLLSFTTVDQLDAVLQNVRKHMKPRGKFWVDIFQPNLQLLAALKSIDLDPHSFYVHSLGRSVMKSTSVQRHPARQVQQVAYYYRWFDGDGIEHRQRTEFSMTFMFPRELQLLLERNGLEIEQLYGNYDGSKLSNDSPRMIACCRKM